MKLLGNICILASLLLPGWAHAAVISEIMYDVEGTDTGREWIEIYNDSAEDVDLSQWKIFESGVSHKIAPTGASVVPPNGYAIVADSPEKFLADHLGFSGILFDSAFSLTNGGETLILKDASDAPADTVAYQGIWGAGGDGSSLQKKSDGTWLAAAPSVAGATIATQSDPASNNEQDEPGSARVAEEEYSAHASQVPATISFDDPELAVTLGRPRLGFVGVPLAFEARIKSMKNIPVTGRASYAWSMGDGTKENGQFIAHAYEFPGDYIVVLNASNGGAAAVSKTSVRIVEPRILLKAGVEHVEIENLDVNELNLGGFSIESGGAKFLVPEDTLIAPKSKISLSLSAMKLGGGQIALKRPSGKVLAKTVAPIAEGEFVIDLPYDAEILKRRLSGSVR